MPKVNEEYIKKKQNQILDAAYKVAMSRPIYDVSMRDVIAETGFSQGSIYNYYSNLDDILIALINQKCSFYGMDKEIEKILTQNFTPEKIMEELFMLWKDVMLKNLVGVGKIYFEVCTIYANDHDKLRRYQSEVQLFKQDAIFQEKSFGWIIQKIKEGYFKPKLPMEDIAIFIATSLDGITRDLILHQYYHVDDVLSTISNFNASRMIYSVYLATFLLLGGNIEKIKIGDL